MPRWYNSGATQEQMRWSDIPQAYINATYILSMFIIA